MAVPANTTQTFGMIGIREDLSDTITMLETHLTPFYSKVARKGKAKNRTPEWERDAYRASNKDNAAIEGDDVTPDAQGQPEILKNVVQLFDQTVSVSSTSDAVDAAGRKKEMKRQILKAGRELKTDIEAAITQNNASVLGNASTAGKLGGAESWLETNTDRGGTGADGGYNSGTGLVDAPTDGTARALAESQLKTVVRSIWDNGGQPTMIMVGSFNKQQASENFAGISTQYTQNAPSGKPLTIMGAADMYRSDFGMMRIVPNRHMRAKTMLVLTPHTWQCKHLQPFKVEKLGKTGHNNKRLLSCELTLCCKEERSNGVVADLTTS